MIISKIIENIRKHPDKLALIYKGQRLTYAQLFSQIKHRATLLHEVGNRIFLLDASSEFQNLLNHLAAQWLGLSSVFSSKNLSEIDKNELIEREKLIRFTYESYDFFKSEVPHENEKFNRGDYYFLGVLTSGSSGVPKLIWKTNACWERAFEHQSSVFDIDASDTVFIIDALGYSANLNAALHALWAGATLFISQLTKAKNWEEEILTHEISSVFLVPSHLKLLSLERLAESKLKSLVTAGEKLDVRLAKTICSKLTHVRLTEYYGTAELGHITYQQNDAIWNFPVSVGLPFPEVNVTIRQNHIYVDSPYVSPEYKAINTVFDLGYFQEGRLVLLGRAGRMFNRRGLNIFAEEIEQKVLQFKGIDEAVVLPLQLNSGRDILCLFYTKIGEFETKLSKTPHQMLRQYLNEILPPAKRPNRIIALEDIPKLANGKTNFEEIKRIYKSAHELLDTHLA